MMFLGRRLGIDLWSYSTKDGRSLRKAAEWLMPYVEDPTTWTYGDGKFAKTSPIDFFWMISAATGDTNCTAFFRKQMTPPDQDKWRSSRWMLLLPIE